MVTEFGRIQKDRVPARRLHDGNAALGEAVRHVLHGGDSAGIPVPAPLPGPRQWPPGLARPDRRRWETPRLKSADYGTFSRLVLIAGQKSPDIGQAIFFGADGRSVGSETSFGPRRSFHRPASWRSTEPPTCTGARVGQEVDHDMFGRHQEHVLVCGCQDFLTLLGAGHADRLDHFDAERLDNGVARVHKVPRRACSASIDSK